MALLIKPNAVFLHIPKTGGSWVRQVLKRFDLVQAPAGKEHATYDQHFWHDRFHRDPKVLRNLARRAVGWLPKVPLDCYRFCFVREPLSWYVSWWRFMQGLNWRYWGDEKDPGHWHPLAMLNGLGSPDFNTFMYNVNRKRPGFVTELFGWYVRPGINFMGKQETLVSDLAKVFSALNLDITTGELLAIERANESRATIPIPVWDPALKRETMRLEYPAYIRYGYPMEPAIWQPVEKRRTYSIGYSIPNGLRSETLEVLGSPKAF
jgi:hypothetical protein